MAKKIYEPCGKIVSTSTSKIAKVKTHLPDSITTYQYVKYYNISTPTQYGILGVLIHEGTNRDLRTLGGDSDDLSVSGGNIDLLNDLDVTFSARSFAPITSSQSIIFICFHDDDFANEEKDILTHYSNNIHLYPHIPPYKSLPNGTPKNPNKGVVWADPPKIGDGGILTFTGSC